MSQTVENNVSRVLPPNYEYNRHDTEKERIREAQTAETPQTEQPPEDPKRGANVNKLV